MTKQEFCKKFKITPTQYIGVDKITGDLDLSGLTSIPDGFNPTVGGSLDLRSITSIPDGFNPTVGGGLFLRSITSIPDGFNPTVGGGLYLHSLTSIPDGFNPTVGGYLDLSGLTSIPDGFNPTVGGGLFLRSITSIPDGFNPTVGGGLDLSSLTSIPDGFNPTVGGGLFLSSLTSIPDGFNPTVGGSLFLRSLTSIPDGFNPTVGGGLDLRSLTSIPDGFNPTVGGDLYMGGNLSTPVKRPTTNLIFLCDGKYVSADGMFTEVIQKIDESTFLVRKLNSEKKFYLVTDLAFMHAHGDTLEQAKADFEFKVESERLKHEPLTMDSIITISRYRIITGACQVGVDDWISSNIPADRRDEILSTGISVRELLPVLERTSAYGLDKFKSLLQGQ